MCVRPGVREFPNPRAAYAAKKEHYPTILFFRTGSYTMMGGTEENILKKCEEFVISLIKKFDKRVESSSSMMQ